MAKTRILNTNYLDLDFLSSASASSENASFPDENLYNAQRRSKVWRSNGYWEITSENTSLVFRETVGVDLTATIAEGTYTSTALLLAAIKTAMEDVGASTYTWTVDTNTLKIKVSSNGLGGGGILQMKWTLCDDIADLLGFDDATDDTGALTYTADLLKIHSEEWIKWDFGISSNPQAFVLIGARNAAIKISPTATIKLQGNETDIWTGPSYDQSITYDSEVMSKFKADANDGLHTEALRFWRLKIVDSDNPNGYIEIGSLFLGEFWEPTRGAIGFPFDAEYIDRSTTIFSEGGQTFTDIREKTEAFNLEWRGLTIAEKEVLDDIFDTFGVSIPFFVQIDPDNAMSTDTNYLRYVKMEQAPRYQLLSPGNYSVSFRIREEL